MRYNESFYVNVTLGKCIVCQCNNIMHYTVLHTVKT